MNEDYSRVALVIPAYEPDEKLIGLLDDLRQKNIERILIVDDGSGEAYRHIFDEAEEHIDCRLFRHAVNLGKGRALKDAFNYCLNEWPDIAGVVTADSDGQHTAEDIVKVMAALQADPDKLVLGVRCFTSDNKDIPARSMLGNRITSGVFKVLLGIKVSDTQTGLRGIGTGFMKHLMSVGGERYEFETNMLLETHDLQIAIEEVPIHTVYIEENATSHFRPVRDSIRIYALFFKYIMSSCASSVIDLGLFTLLCSLLRDRSLPIDYILLATVLARIVSATCNYFINLKVVFATGTSVKNSVWKYALLAMVTMLASATLVRLIYPLFGGLELLVKLPVDVLLFFINFTVQREIVYKKKMPYRSHTDSE